MYDEVGYAGLVWHNYDLGCAGTAVFNPATTTDTWLGNQTLNVAKFVVGGVNWSHYLIADGGKLLSPLDKVISDGTRAMYDAVFTTWVGPALLILAVMLLVLALRGDLARQTQRAGMAAGRAGLRLRGLPRPGGLGHRRRRPAARRRHPDAGGLPRPGRAGRPGHPADRARRPGHLPELAARRVRLAGRARRPRQLGRELLRAQTFTKAEIAEHRDTMELAAQKKAGVRRGRATGWATATPTSRASPAAGSGAGLLAVVQAACIGLFQLLSKVLVLVAMLVLRLLVMTAPAVAVVAILKPDILPALLRVAGAAIVNTLVVGALAGLHALLVVSLFRPGAGIDLWLSLLVTGVVTVVLWAVARPFRRLVSMVSLTREQFGGIVPGAGSGPMSRVWQRLRGSELDDRQTRWWSERQRGAAGDAGYPDGGRPEAAPGVRIPAQATATAIRRPARPDGRPGTAPRWRAPRRPAAAGRRGRVRARPGAAELVRPGRRRPGARSTTGCSTGGRTRCRCVPAGPGRSPAELVDGETVYRIYRPGSRRTVYTPTGRSG